MSTLEEFFALREGMWKARDACATHYPRLCPEGCPGKGEVVGSENQP